MTSKHTYQTICLPKVDIASMAVSLEARSPFLDHKVIEFAATLPENLKMNKLTPKYLLKKVAAKLVPSDVIYRKKMGFGVPLGNWFRGGNEEFCARSFAFRKMFETRNS